MLSPSSCPRCSKPLALASPSGLCPECAATADTAVPTSPAFLPGGPASAPPTATAAPPSAPSTATAHPAGITVTGGEASPTTLPHAPAGYDLLDRLGTGGMGAVYLAREQAAERLVAMKFLHSPASPDSLERFLVELRVLARLDHPNIVRVLASDFLRADPYFTMEHMPGGSLSRAMDADTPIPVAEAVRLVRIVADAIAAAHAQGVIHRDLKPSNILLSADGTPKISDFGLAKRLEFNDQLTVTGGALGTPSYMPPEQISRKNGEIGPWSDVYGLGATLYHLLVGRAPFVGESPEEIIPQVLLDPPARLRGLRPDIPAALEGIVLKCLEKDPKDRYQTMAELAADLDRFTAGQRPVAPPLTRWRRAKRWAKRNRWGVVSSAVGAAIVVALVAFFLTNPARAKTDAERIAEIRGELAAGRPVVLVDEKGRTQYKRWVVGTGEFVAPETGTATCWARYEALLELCPSPEIDRYRISGEIRQLESTGRVELRGVTGFTVGFYFGYDLRVAGDATKVHTYSSLRFSDYHPSPAKRALRGIECEDNLLIQPQLQSSSGASHGIDWFPTDPVPSLPGPWRKFTIELTPDRIEVRDDRESQSPAPIVHDLTEINARIARLQNDLNTPPLARLASGVELSRWSPRRAFGIRLHGACVEVKNVVVTPFPASR